MNRRNALIAAGAVTGVLLAGAAAVAANTSILNAADSDEVGNLSAAAVINAVPAEPDPQVLEPQVPEPQVIDIYVDDPVAPVTVAAPSTVVSIAPDNTIAPRADALGSAQVYNVDDAGTVAIAQTDDGLMLGAVTVNDGWTWAVDEISPPKIGVTFESGSSTYVFTAALADDGSIDARVEEPIVRVVQAPAPANNASTNSSGTSTSADDDHDEDDESDERDDHDDEHDDDDHDEREGGADDD